MSEPLQFDRADDVANANAGTSVRSCASCQTPIVDRYYTFGDKLLCTGCHTQLLASLQQRFASGSFGAALLRGGGAALLGAAIYYGVTAISGYTLGLISVLVGYLVGKGVAQGSRGKGGLGYQFLALGLTYLSIALSYAPEVFRGMAQSNQQSTLGYIFSILVTLIAPVYIVFKAPLSAVINAFALWEAWKLNRAVQLPITGPHVVNKPPAHVG